MTSSKIKDFTHLTIDESNKKNSISYSQYSMYEQCNHRWKLNYIDKHRTFTDSIHTLFGTGWMKSFKCIFMCCITKVYQKQMDLTLTSY